MRFVGCGHRGLADRDRAAERSACDRDSARRRHSSAAREPGRGRLVPHRRAFSPRALPASGEPCADIDEQARAGHGRWRFAASSRDSGCCGRTSANPVRIRRSASASARAKGPRGHGSERALARDLPPGARARTEAGAYSGAVRRDRSCTRRTHVTPPPNSPCARGDGRARIPAPARYRHPAVSAPTRRRTHGAAACPGGRG